MPTASIGKHGEGSCTASVAWQYYLVLFSVRMCP